LVESSDLLQLDLSVTQKIREADMSPYLRNLEILQIISSIKSH
jgi:hypothetical protein